jgi:hypothetical protein
MREIDKIRNIYKILQEQPEPKQWMFPADFIHTSMSISLGKLTVDVREGNTRRLFLTGAMHDLELLSLLRHKWHTVCSLLPPSFLPSSPSTLPLPSFPNTSSPAPLVPSDPTPNKMLTSPLVSHLLKKFNDGRLLYFGGTRIFFSASRPRRGREGNIFIAKSFTYSGF